MIPLDVASSTCSAPSAVASSLAVVAQRNPMHSVLLLIVSFVGARRALHQPRLAVRRGDPDHRLRRRDHGAVPVRGDAAERAARGVASPYGPSYVTLTTGPRKVFAVLSVGPGRRARRGADAVRDASLPAGPDAAAHVSSVRQIGIAIFTDYTFAFEVTSVLILVAMVGAVVLAKKKL